MIDCRNLSRLHANYLCSILKRLYRWLESDAHERMALAKDGWAYAQAIIESLLEAPAFQQERVKLLVDLELLFFFELRIFPGYRIFNRFNMGED
jgi:hypothetical protein